MKEINITERAKKEIRKIFNPRNTVSTLKNDPELTEIVDNFAFDETLGISDEGPVKETTRILCILTSTMAQYSKNEFKMYVDAALNVGVKPSEIREVVYQAVPYLGYSSVLCFLQIMNEVFANNDIRTPLHDHATVARADRHEAGKKIMEEVFGKDAIESMISDCPKGQEHIMEYLESYCFGDFFTRRGLTLQIRALMTFCLLTSMGGCDKQMVTYAHACKRLGTTKQEMVGAVTAMLPYIGFPRSFNGLNAINEAYSEKLSM